MVLGIVILITIKFKNIFNKFDINYKFFLNKKEMKAITKLMDDEPYFSTNVLEYMVVVSIFIFYFLVTFILSLFVSFTSNQFITNCIAMTIFTLFYYEEKIVSYIEKHSDNMKHNNIEIYSIKDRDNESSSVDKKSIIRKTTERNKEIDYVAELVEIMSDDIPKIAFDIIGVIKSVPSRSYSLACEKNIVDVIYCVNEVIRVFGRQNVYFIGSGSFEEEWSTKNWLEINGIVKETNMLRKNILFVKSDSDSKLSHIDEEKRKLCVELGITHYVDDREQATHIVSQSIPFTILYSDSQFEKQLLSDNLKDYDNIRIEYTDSLINLKNLIIDSYDRYFNRKTRFTPKPVKNDDYLNPYYLEQDDKKYVILPFDKKIPPTQLKHISFLILYDDNNTDWVNLGDPFTAGYINDDGIITLSEQMEDVCL